MKIAFKKRYLKEYAWGYLMILPLVAGLCVFYFYPVFKVIRDSFYDVGAFGKSKWIGIGNYEKMINDATMWQALGNTFKYVIMITPITIIIALLLATFLNMGIKGKTFFRVVYFAPSITMAAAVAMVWRWLYNGDYGLFNYILNWMGIDSVQFLTNPKVALFAIGTVSIWSLFGHNMIIFLAGIQGIPKTYYEAASIDGANEFKQFFHITLPLLSPTIFFVMITLLINVFQIFDTIYMMVGEKNVAMEASQSAVVYFYRNAFIFSKKGYASALAVFLFVIIMIFTVLQMIGQKKWVHYE